MNNNLKLNNNYSLNYLNKLKVNLTKIRSKAINTPAINQNENTNKTENIKVYIRCKPFIKENKKILNIININKNEIIINNPNIYVTNKREICFKFNNIFDTINNENLFKKIILKNIKSLIDGYSYTIFCYGITGSGKTYTLFGKNWENGLFQYSCLELLKIPNIKITLNFLEIYNEKVYDLLSNNNKVIQIHDNIKSNNLIEILINKPEQIKKIIDSIENKRKKAETINNINSTRSHVVCYINIENKINEKKVLTSKLTIIDLAGSEKFLGGKEKNLRQKEGANINKSLLTLTNCIQAIINKSKNSYIPYRDSKITRIMKETLTGNTQTAMVCCIHKSSNFFENTLNTLNYASKTMECKKEITQNINEKETNKNLILADNYITLEEKNNNIINPNRIRKKNINYINKNFRKFKYKANKSYSNLKKNNNNNNILNNKIKNKILNWEKISRTNKFLIANKYQDYEIIEDNLNKANNIIREFENHVKNNELKNYINSLKNYLDNAIKAAKVATNKSISYEGSIQTNNNIYGLKTNKKSKISQEKTIKNYSTIREKYKNFKNDLKFISQNKGKSNNFIKKVLKVINVFSNNGYVIDNNLDTLLDNINKLEDQSKLKIIKK